MLPELVVEEYPHPQELHQDGVHAGQTLSHQDYLSEVPDLQVDLLEQEQEVHQPDDGQEEWKESMANEHLGNQWR